MEFAWAPEQQAAYDEIWKQSRTWPAAAPGFFSRTDWQRCADLGILGLSVPPQYGGRGHGVLTTARSAEAFGRGCPDMGLVFSALAHLLAVTMPIVEHGGEELRARVLPRLCSGEWIGANAITEDEAGSDVTALATRAQRVQDGYLLTGAKSFVSNGPVADLFLVYAVTDPTLGHFGVSAFAIERDTPGLTVGEPFSKFGLESCPAGTLVLRDCLVPAGHRIGAEGRGSAIFQGSMKWERTCLFAAYLGQAERLLERCVEHARSRRQFGRPIGSNQAISHTLARMRVALESARLLLWQASWQLDQGDPAVLGVAMAKLAASECAVEAGLQTLRVLGSAAVRSDSGVERDIRDSLPSTIFSGTTEMQLELIAKELGL
jgi:alkylation response protein AidB-like acyl-CoA dehydrogenase